MKRINNQKLKRNNHFYYFLTFPLIVFFLISCDNSNKEKTEADLPFIGNYDLVLTPMEGYKVGDTIFHTVPDWEYLTQDSILLQSSDIKNKIWIADFFFSNCPTICVPMNESLNSVIDTLAELNKDIAYLSFSIDPKRDTPSQLQEYKKEHNFTAKKWYFLTGDQKETQALAIKGFQVLAQEDKAAAGGFLHSSNFVLVDKNKHIRGIYNSLSKKDCDRLITDVKLLLHAK